MRSKRPSAPSFATLFGALPTVAAAAPGRVNLLGEHTDYNLGWVLPTAIPQQTHIELRVLPTGPRQVHVWSSAVASEDPAIALFSLGSEAPQHRWLDYVQGVTHRLAAEGVPLPGFELRITSDVPLGSGLSSSASLLVALFRALRQALSLSLSDIAIARLCQRVENDFVGAPVGILDPMACVLCQPGQALLLDTRDLQHQRIPLPTTIEPVVIHSGIVHAHRRDASQRPDSPSADYRTRRAECEQAAALLGVPSLRALQDDPLASLRCANLPAVLAARVRHVLSENARVLQAATVLKKSRPGEQDLRDLAALFAASHHSQSVDYEVSLPALDTLVALAASDPGVLPGAARLTGGGFGGSIVALAQAGCAQAAAVRIAATYQQQTGHSPTILVPADDVLSAQGDTP